MEFEVLKRSHLKRNILIGVVVVAVISAIVLNFTRAKYRVTQSIPLVNGTINYTPYDLNIIALYIDGVEAEELDSNTDYTLDTTQSTCTYKDGSTIPNLTLSYDSDTKTFTITPYTTRGTKCILYFEEKPLASDVILAGKDIQERSSFSSVLSTSTNGIIYQEQTSDGTTYYFAGDTDENWVSFAGYYWRIIRINEDGSVRMIYNGTSTSQTGAGTQIQTSAFNSSSNDNAYVGYMYGSTGASSYSATHTNTNDSAIKEVIDGWYKDNLLGEPEEDLISTEAGFCNDRRTATSSETFWTSDTKRGYGRNVTVYAPVSRFLTTSSSWDNIQTPTFECSQDNDLFTVSNSSKGNNDLDYPIGLISADEVVYAGGFGGSDNSSYYLYTRQDYWTMSPDGYTSGLTSVFLVYSEGTLSRTRVRDSYGVRPVINLKADVTITGSGTSTDPYQVD